MTKQGAEVRARALVGENAVAVQVGGRHLIATIRASQAGERPGVGLLACGASWDEAVAALEEQVEQLRGRAD